METNLPFIRVGVGGFLLTSLLQLDMCKAMKHDDAERKKLEARKNAIAASVPAFEEIVRGSLFERTIKCGKPSCHCAQGQGHPVTYLSVTLEGGKTVQITVPKDLVPQVQRWVDNYSALWSALEEISEVNRQLLRSRLLKSAPRKRRGR